MSYHIFGDSNICRYLPSVKARSTDPQYETITFTKVTNLVALRDALTRPEASHPIIVVSALTNLLVAKYFDNFDAMLVHCKAIFTDLLTWIQEGRDTCSGFATQVCTPVLILTLLLSLYISVFVIYVLPKPVTLCLMAPQTSNAFYHSYSRIPPSLISLKVI